MGKILVFAAIALACGIFGARDADRTSQGAPIPNDFDSHRNVGSRKNSTQPTHPEPIILRTALFSAVFALCGGPSATLQDLQCFRNRNSRSLPIAMITKRS